MENNFREENFSLPGFFEEVKKGEKSRRIENPHAVATAINKKWLSMMTSWISDFPNPPMTGGKTFRYWKMVKIAREIAALRLL